MKTKKMFFTILALGLTLASFGGMSRAQTPPQPVLTNLEEFAPHLAVGCGGETCWQTVITLINRTDASQGIGFFFLDNGGNPLYLTITLSSGIQTFGNGGGAGMLPSDNVTFTLSLSVNDTVRTGVIRFYNFGAQWSSKQNRYLPNIEVQEVFQLVNRFTGRVLSSVGVNVGLPDTAFMGQAMITDRVDIGVAMYNPNNFSIKVHFTVFNLFAIGGAGPYATADVALLAHQQLPRFLGEIFANLGNDSGGNKITDGNMSLTAIKLDGTPANFYCTLLRADNPAKDQYSSVPLYAGREQ